MEVMGLFPADREIMLGQGRGNYSRGVAPNFRVRGCRGGREPLGFCIAGFGRLVVVLGFSPCVSAGGSKGILPQKIYLMQAYFNNLHLVFVYTLFSLWFS